MSLDDQLFKQDGTMLTKADVLMLKSSRLIMDFLFAEDDDETYDRSLKRILKNAVILTVLYGILTGFIGNFMGTFFAFLIAWIWWPIAKHAKCNGLGTNVPQVSKAISLVFITVPVIDLERLFFSEGIVDLVANIVHTTGFFLFFLGSMYVVRLQNKPPKKKRARVFKFAFNHG